jgi:hypothetical protein
MTSRLLGMLFMLTAAAGQQTSASASTKAEVSEPALPLIEYETCPREGASILRVKIRRVDKMYSSLWDHRKLVGQWEAGAR